MGTATAATLVDYSPAAPGTIKAFGAALNDRHAVPGEAKFGVGRDCEVRYDGDVRFWILVLHETG
jgi:hypothetical protein